MPPVGMMIVVRPAFRASRTSIHVISSSHTVSGCVSGFGVSMQLYGFALQFPPPALRGSRCPRPWFVRGCSVCAGAVDWAATTPESVITISERAAFFMIGSLGDGGAPLPDGVYTTFRGP